MEGSGSQSVLRTQKDTGIQLVAVMYDYGALVGNACIY